MNGAIKWMASNHVASNILMLILIVGGIVIGSSVKQEVFPEFELDMVNITVPYPGASPAEVEDGILQPLERAISGVDNVKRMIANAGEGVGNLVAEVMDGANIDEVLSDIKSEVDRITTFPQDAEEPIVAKATNKKEVITLIIYGDVSERALYEQAERVRDDLLAKPNISQASLKAVRPLEISVEISEENLRRYNLTLNVVAGIIRRSSLDMPGGSIKTEGGEVLIRTNEKRYTGAEFDSVVVFTSPRGERVLLGDIATVTDGFAEYDLEALFDGHRAAMVRVFRVGAQTPKDVSTTVKEYIEYIKPQLPSSIDVEIWTDSSVILQQRIDLLLRNGRLGFILVLITLALFLEIRLALWVAIGAGISFLGAMAFLPMMGVSINMLSLFAFLIVLGVVVDDAIIVGENIHVHRKNGKSYYKAAYEGTYEVTRPVVFAILTTIAAFSPLLFVSGMMGKFMGVIPRIVIIVLVLSLIESLFILPAHLSGKMIKSQSNFWLAIENQRQKFDRFVRWMIDYTYEGTLKWVVVNRYTTIAISTAVLLGAIGLVTGGYVKFVFFPRVDADFINVSLTMAPGTAFDQTKEIAEHIQKEGMELVAEYDEQRDDGESELLHTFASVGTQASAGMSTPMDRGSPSASNLAIVSMLFVGSDVRTIRLQQFTNEWRKRIGPIPGMEKLNFKSVLMHPGDDIDIQLAHEDYAVLVKAVDRVKEALAGYGGVEEINDSYTEGKRELKLRLKPEASSLGITETDLAMQVRGAFYGAEALRLQRGRNEVKVMVRYPENARRMMASIEDMRIRTPMGGEVPFSQAAYVDDSQGYSGIKRVDRKRVINVTASVDNKTTNNNDVLSEVTQSVLPQLMLDYPGLSYDLEGDSRNRHESLGSLKKGFIIALFMIYALLAIPFRSFSQPFVVMSAIPFGMVGAVLGHLLLGYNLSFISTLGIVALSGVVVNDSLVMIDFINRARDSGLSLREAVLTSGKRRFRPIILTSLTTFFGLTPMILETSMQARFMIPMAISLGFGVLFATGITLVLIPAMYLVLEDIQAFFGVEREVEPTASLE